MPKLIVSMYGCNGEFNEAFNFNKIPVEVIIGDKDPLLKKCEEFKKRITPLGHGSEIKINVIPNAEHSFDESYPAKLWDKNQETSSCFIILKRDGSAENPFIGKTYNKGEYNYTVGARDCMKIGEKAGNNGNAHIGDNPLLSSIATHIGVK
jgi:hypothetical protein